MAMKGSATIELTNADGSKEIIKHDNMITNAVNDLCVSQRGEMATILKMVNQGDNYAQTMFGGLLLFDAELNSDPSDYVIPSTKITGYASQNAYTGLDLARGSFNGAEGGVQEDGSYKFVWDFGTSQGNGTIKSLALCPNIMGRIGATDTRDTNGDGSSVEPSLRAPSEPFNSYGRMLNSSGETAGISNWCYNIVAVKDDIAYALDYYNVFWESGYKSRCISENGGVLKIHRFKLGASSISLADEVGMARYIDCIDVQLPAAFTSVLYISRSLVGTYYDVENSKLIVFPASFKDDVPINGTFPYIDIDFNNQMRVTSYTFTNTTAGTMAKFYGYNSNIGDSLLAYTFFVIKDYIIVATGNPREGYSDMVGNIYIVDRNDNTKIVKATLSGADFEFTGYNYTKYLGIVPHFVGKNILVFAIGGSSGGAGIPYILDLTTGVCKKTNYPKLYPPYNNFGSDVAQICTGPYLKYYVNVNPFILTTKNNLDSPVIKTASQTMKITYTLSEVNESEV